eukprot:Protomagalhaensia_sp_Gyna_25__6063@NODE_965_length_2346_cov_480_412657_g767_i0_p2_GENE_NODE_965_length_2346_cov_480_412657_g767_i0NODE_965_length_2346_cov_480_412657_g767_i0_p2_ORF_typecomplete_len228_score29_80GATA/PF00320_27/0_00022zinc_ribbon_12/PF11331_8/0_46zinc_ribbon_12/PF11331_8/1_1e04_NODE_965_length_2346_cov_480_412657_g767_i0167850
MAEEVALDERSHDEVKSDGSHTTASDEEIDGGPTICLETKFSFFGNEPPPTAIFRFNLSDTTTLSAPSDLDQQILTLLEADHSMSRVRRGVVYCNIRVVKSARKAGSTRRRQPPMSAASRVSAPSPSATTAVSSVASSSSSNSRKKKKMRCLRCSTLETPQWRYIHKGRYCNACYMRVKRWVENNKPGRRLPSRSKTVLSSDEDARLQRDADDLVSQAFEALEKQGA